MKNLFPNSPVLKRISVIGVTVLAVLLVVITMAYAIEDFTVIAKSVLRVGASRQAAAIYATADSTRFSKPVLFNSTSTFAGTQAYTGASSFAGGITGNVTFSGNTITISGIAVLDTINGTIVFTGPVSIAGTTTLDTVIGTVVFTGGVTANSNLTVTGTVTGDTLAGSWFTTGKFTFPAIGLNYALRTITAGDSVFLHQIVDAADTTLKIWNGTSWVTVQDLIP